MRISISGLRSVALAIMTAAILAAAFPAQGRADVCTECRTAIAFDEAATATLGKHHLPDLNSRAAFDEYARTSRALLRVVKEARIKLRNAERAVRDSIEDEAAAAAMDALAAIEAAHAAALRAIIAWLGHGLPGSPGEERWQAITGNGDLGRVAIAARNLYRAALLVVCAGGFARSGE